MWDRRRILSARPAPRLLSPVHPVWRAVGLEKSTTSRPRDQYYDQYFLLNFFRASSSDEGVDVGPEEDFVGSPGAAAFVSGSSGVAGGWLGKIHDLAAARSIL